MKIGILGGGQLGRMLALAAYPLGMRVRVFDPAADACAGQVAEHVCAPFGDEAALRRFAAGLDVVTFEWENVPEEAARLLAAELPVRPSPEALAAAQDRLAEKNLFRSAGIETARFLPVDSLDDLESAVPAIGVPAVLKSRRGGYDGKGQYVVRSAADIEAAWAAVGGACIVESFVEFERELSIVAARGLGGETRFYPLVENRHRDGILRLTLAPAPGLTPELQAAGESIAQRVMETLEYTGVIAIELFQCGDKLLANELATRVHNSGHWTLDGAAMSQFENHMRAVAGLPLGDASACRPTAMVNLIGALPETAKVLSVEGAHLHLYGKEPRPGRKLGHVNVTAADEGQLQRRLRAVLQLLEEAS